LTRAKKKVYLLIETPYKSTFIKEMEADYRLNKEATGKIIKCPA